MGLEVGCLVQYLVPIQRRHGGATRVGRLVRLQGSTMTLQPVGVGGLKPHASDRERAQRVPREAGLRWWPKGARDRSLAAARPMEALDA